MWDGISFREASHADIVVSRSSGIFDCRVLKRRTRLLACCAPASSPQHATIFLVRRRSSLRSRSKRGRTLSDLGETRPWAILPPATARAGAADGVLEHQTALEELLRSGSTCLVAQQYGCFTRALISLRRRCNQSRDCALPSQTQKTAGLVCEVRALSHSSGSLGWWIARRRVL